ncbi:MAG: enoyl-CoA hydratase [Chloroflexi bacterium]|nr:enoyl-CoA hydratase [Chloroflexota bacterium]
MDYQNILLAQAQSIATITLNRPATYNALNKALMEELVTALDACRDNDEVRAVVITGAGPAFCAGGDLKGAKDYIDQGGRPSRYFLDIIKPFHRFVTELRLLPKPVIASINGTAAGAGFSIAAACDLRIASQKVVFHLAYTQIGLVPDGGWTAFVPAILGLGLASEQVFLNRPIPAEEALRLGLIHRLVSPEELEQATQEMAGKLASGPTAAFGRAKALLNASVLDRLEAQLERERQSVGAMADTDDFREALSAFLEKRPPRYVGH